MKLNKVFILVILLFIPQVNAKTYTWSDLNQTCFYNYAEITSPSQGTIKIKVSAQDTLFFVQDNKILPARVFDYGQEEYLNYKILNSSGITEEEKKNMSYLYDQNLQTSLDFDPYLTGEKELLLDFGDVLKANTFKLELDYTGNLEVDYFISKDNQNYIEVSNPEDYDWRYLKLQFEKYSSRDSKNYNLKINDLLILSQSPYTYLVNTKSRSDVKIYTNFRCENENWSQILNQMRTAGQQAQFSLSAETKNYEVDFLINPQYCDDFDGDGILNDQDNCPYNANTDQADEDVDLVGDACDYDNSLKNFEEQDRDNDGVGDSLDNCPNLFNPKQVDSNADKHGDLCSDDDHDGVIGYKDNCIFVKNSAQTDININGIGDACEFDKDKDGIFDSVDNCITQVNQNQSDQDQDGIGDACDNCKIYNPQQIDKNQNGVGDLCEQVEEHLEKNDQDEDGVIDSQDNCKKIANANQLDTDKDRIGDACDNCPKLRNHQQIDRDENEVGDLCEDSDQDGVEGYLDNCMYHSNANQQDADNDGIGDVCEDDDHDGFLAIDDNCPFDSNQNQWDVDRDGIGDVCDPEDNRLLESNKGVVIGFIVLITLLFGGMIFALLRKIQKNKF